MTVFKRMLSLALTLALGASLLAGCSNGDSASSSSSQDSSASSSADASTGGEAETMDLSAVTDPYLATAGIAGDTVVGRVGEYEITAGEVLYWLNYQTENYLYQMQSMGYPASMFSWDATDENGKTAKDTFLTGALEAAALYQIMPILCEDAQLELSQEDLDMPEKFLDSCVQQLGTEEAMRHLLWSQMMTEEGYTKFYHGGCQVQLLQDYYYGEGTDEYPTDAEVKDYAENGLGYYRVKHILLSVKDAATGELLDDAAKQAKRATAMDLLEQLRQADDPVALFDTLMNEHSEDPGLASYPNGYDAYPGQMVAEFEKASLALQVGEISEIVESEHGYHIILRLPLEDLDDLRATMVSELMNERVAQILSAYGITRTAEFEKIDPASFREKVVILQNTVQQELEAITAGK